MAAGAGRQNGDCLLWPSPLILKHLPLSAPFGTPPRLPCSQQHKESSGTSATARHGTVRSAPLHRLGRARRGVGLCARRGQG
jgi:hypothetical protein